MKKIIVILCIKVYKSFPNSIDWAYYHDILGKYISPAGRKDYPKWYRSWVYKIGEWAKERLFEYIKKNKKIAKEYHEEVIRKKNANLIFLTKKENSGLYNAY